MRIPSEINPPLKAIATVISSMKKASKQTVSKKTWNQIIGLYPYLVQFTETNSPQIGKAVKDALLEYHDLLQPLLCPWFMNKFLLEYITIEVNQKLAFFGFKIDLFWFETNPGIKDLYQVQETWKFFFLTHIQLCVL